MKRVQRKRVAGWRMPPNTVYVGRPTKWGNPFKITEMTALNMVLYRYRKHIEEKLAEDPKFLDLLRGKDLACWCPLIDKNGNPVPCHADILLEFLKKEEVEKP